MPCPLAEEGECPYRRAYRCTAQARDLSRADGRCLIEVGRVEASRLEARKGLQFPSEGELPRRYAAAVELYAEAGLYFDRVIAFLAIHPGLLHEPWMRPVMRYFVAAGTALALRTKNLKELARRRAEEVAFSARVKAVLGPLYHPKSAS